MQFHGNMGQCWTLTSFASRILVSLNYHTWDGLSPSCDTESQIHGAIFTCYHFDKHLSSLLLRPPSLPELKIKPAELIQLDPHIPLSAIMKAIVELAQIQEVTLSLALKPGLSNETDQRNTINGLVETMYSMHSEYQKVCPDQDCCLPAANDYNNSNGSTHLSVIWSTSGQLLTSTTIQL